MGQRIAAATKGHGESARIAFNSTSPGPFVSGSYLTPGGNDVYLGNWQSYPTNPYYGLGLNSMQTLFVLHELLHVMDLQDRFADADDAERHFQNSRTVSLRCKL